MRADLNDLSCVCDEIARVIKSAESNKIAESSAIFLLQGDIGAGKTTLVREFAKYVGISDSVTSPTFSLLHIYGTESRLDSANSQNLVKNNPSLRDSAKQNRGKPPIEKTQDLQSGLPRSHLLARNDKNLDSSLRKCSAQNDKLKKIAESALDSANSQNLVKNNPSLRDSAKQNRGNPSIEKTQNLQGGLPRSHSLARNDDSFLDSANSQNLTIYHYDLYQKGVDSALDLGLLDLLGENGIHFVEWGDERLFNIIKNAFENIFIIQITKAKNDRIYEFKSEF